MRPTGRVIGLDLGSRRIGVAVSDSDQIVATGVDTLARADDVDRDHQAVAALVDEYDAIGVVVGLPLSLSGGMGPTARAVVGEIEQMRTTVPVEIEMVDERFTTVAASGALRAAGRRGRDQRSVIDRTAAAFLLQTWLDSRRRAGETTS